MNDIPTASPSHEGMDLDALKTLIANTTYARQFGVEITAYGDGQVELTFPVTPALKQHHGFVHGAVIGFAADSACAWAAASLLGDVVTSEYKINLIAPAVGTRVIARGSANRAGLRNAVCRAEVLVETRKAHQMVAMAQASVAGMQLPQRREGGRAR